MTAPSHVASAAIRYTIAGAVACVCAAVFILLAALVVRLTGVTGTGMILGVIAGTLLPTCAACWFLQPAIDRFADRLTQGGRR